MPARWHEPFLVLYRFIFITYISKSELDLTQHFFLFQDCVRVQGTCLYHYHVTMSWDTTVGSFFVIEITHYSVSGYVLFGQNSSFVPVDMYNFAGSVMSFGMTCWMFIILQVIYFFLFIFPFQHGISFIDCLSCSRVQSLCNFLFLIWLSLQIPIPNHFIFRIQVILYPVVAPSPVLCSRCILSCKNSRLLCSCYVKWPFSYLGWWLPYIWIIVLLKFIYIIMVI